MLGRRAGLKLLDSLRLESRKRYHQRHVVDASRRAEPTYMLLDAFSRAPLLSGDTREDLVLKRVFAWKRPRARYYIGQNAADEAWRAPGDGAARFDAKKRPRRGFAVGTIDELRLQARCGGVRLPCHGGVVGGSKHVAVEGSLVGLVRPRDRLVILGRVVTVREDGKTDSVRPDSVKLRACWPVPTEENAPAVAMYRLPPPSRGGQLLRAAGRLASENALSQSLLLRYANLYRTCAKVEGKLAAALRSRAPTAAAALKRASRKHERTAEVISWSTFSWNYVVEMNEETAAKKLLPDKDSAERREAELDRLRRDSYMGNEPPKAMDWTEGVDGEGKPFWTNKKSGEVTSDKPDELKSVAEMAHHKAKAKMAKQKERRRSSGARGR
mmetsp:Transcript_28848/g.99415  ORF Transcript_28848/g.99415 Transcript_28848/m.99415 type:complete len:384 (+) Transcript_28848:329-1480(+)